MSNTDFNKNTIDVVMYHANCADGFGSAFIVWYYNKINFGINRANQITFIPCSYLNENNDLSNTIFEKIKNKNVLMCDFSYRYSILEKIIKHCNSFMLIDHHKTAENDLTNVLDNKKIFDMTRSGVGITWDYFYPNLQMPLFLQYVQDRDLWTFALNDTNEFIIYLFEQKFDFELWEKFITNTDFVQIAVNKGREWLEYKSIIIKNIVDRASYIIQNVDNHYRIVVYANSSEFKSDIGNKLFEKIPIADFSAVWNYDLYRNVTYYSLRSTNDRMDCSIVAKKLGGGGHRNACGVSFKELNGCLPFERVPDLGVLELLLHGEYGAMENNTTYVLFQVREIRNEWMQEIYLNLIKNKTKNCNFIVFQIKKSKPDSNDSITYDYTILYNEYSSADSVDALHLIFKQANDQTMTFTSHKSFTEIINDILLANVQKKITNATDITDTSDSCCDTCSNSDSELDIT